MKYEPAEELISQKEIDARVSEIAAEISRKYSGQRLVVVGILRGAVIFLTDLVRKIDPSVDVVLEFMRASSYGASTKTSGEVKITQDLDNPIRGAHVLIVEDIVDTGLTLFRLKEYLRQRETASIEICALLDKERRVAPVQVDYAGFDIPDKFVVGYGMDCGERWRNLPSIHVINTIQE